MEALDAELGGGEVDPSNGPAVRDAIDAIEAPDDIAIAFETIVDGLDEVLATERDLSPAAGADADQARTDIERYVAARCDLRLRNF